jgi:hypothetical protein
MPRSSDPVLVVLKLVLQDFAPLLSLPFIPSDLINLVHAYVGHANEVFVITTTKVVNYQPEVENTACLTRPEAEEYLLNLLFLDEDLHEYEFEEMDEETRAQAITHDGLSVEELIDKFKARSDAREVESGNSLCTFGFIHLILDEHDEWTMSHQVAASFW